MTKFNFKVLNVDIFFFFVKNAGLGYLFGESAQWWNKTPDLRYPLLGEVSISKFFFEG